MVCIAVQYQVFLSNKDNLQVDLFDSEMGPCYVFAN